MKLSPCQVTKLLQLSWNFHPEHPIPKPDTLHFPTQFYGIDCTRQNQQGEENTLRLLPMNVCLYIRVCVCTCPHIGNRCYLKRKRKNERHGINPLKTQDSGSICLPHQPISQVNYLDLVVNLSISELQTRLFLSNRQHLHTFNLSTEILQFAHFQSTVLVRLP